MTSARFFLPLGLALAACIGGCGQGDENELQGTWVAQPNERTALFKETWTFEEGKILRDDGPRGPRADWAYKVVDATKQPKQIDINTADWNTRMGIYKIEKDLLTIAYIGPGGPKADAKRPEDFDPTKRNDVVVLTFRRKNVAQSGTPWVPEE